VVHLQSLPLGPVRWASGARRLGNVRSTSGHRLSICEPCGRRERYDVENLKRQHDGDVKMPDLLAALVANCPKARSFSIYDRCKAVYERRDKTTARTLRLRSG
jgi:hypothetical protein